MEDSRRLTVIAPVDETQNTCHDEEAFKNADESDESTGQVDCAVCEG